MYKVFAIGILILSLAQCGVLHGQESSKSPLRSGRLVAQLRDRMNEQIRELPPANQKQVFQLYEARYKQMYTVEKDDAVLQAIHELANLYWANGVSKEKAVDLQRFVISSSERDATIAKSWRQLGMMNWGEVGSEVAFNNAVVHGEKAGMSAEFVASSLTHQASIEFLSLQKPDAATSTLSQIFSNKKLIENASEETILLAANYVMDLVARNGRNPSLDSLLKDAAQYLERVTSSSEKMALALEKIIIIDMESGESKLDLVIQRLEKLFSHESTREKWERVRFGIELLLVKYARGHEKRFNEDFVDVLKTSEEVFDAINDVKNWEKSGLSKADAFREVAVVQSLAYSSLGKTKEIEEIRNELRDSQFKRSRFIPHVPDYLNKEKFVLLLKKTHMQLTDEKKVAIPIQSMPEFSLFQNEKEEGDATRNTPTPPVLPALRNQKK